MATISRRGPYQWQARIRRKGYPTQSRTFEMKADAEAWARAIENEMVRGVFVSRAEAESTTLAECLERYLKEVTPRKKSARQEAMKARNVLRHPIAKLYMANVHGRDIARFRDDRLALGKSPSTVLKEMALISHLFSVAQREWGMESLRNPVSLVSKPKVSNQRDRRLLPGEEERLLAACAPQFHNANIWLKPLVVLALETAMRKGELLALRWQDIDFDKRMLKCRNKDPKGNTLFRHVPLSARAIETLNALPRSVDGRVFQTSENAIKLAFPRACRRACEHVFKHASGKRSRAIAPASWGCASTTCGTRRPPASWNPGCSPTFRWPASPATRRCKC